MNARQRRVANNLVLSLRESAVDTLTETRLLHVGVAIVEAAVHYRDVAFAAS